MLASVAAALTALDMRVGHATTPDGRSGCTVLLCPAGTVAGVDVRGPAPGTRETALLAADKPINHVHAVLLTGGSAFGLAAADGVMRFLSESGIGHSTPVKPIPLVPTAVLYDLVLSPEQHPDRDTGYQACRQAGTADLVGNVGAGTGATAGKWGGPEGAMKCGFGAAAINLNGAWVLAVAAVNPVGDVVGEDGRIIAGARAPGAGWLATAKPLRPFGRPPLPMGTNTTLVAVATNARLTKPEASRLASRCQDGIALAVHPAHTSYDGDTTFALATSTSDTPLELAGNAAVAAVTAAIRRAATTAHDSGGLPGPAGPAPQAG